MVEKIHAATVRSGTGQDTTKVVTRLNRTLRGWANYFQWGSVSKAYKAIDAYTTMRLRRWLRKKHKVRGRGTTRYPDEYLYQKLGLVRLETRTKTLNPKWYEGMLAHGFRGVAEIENHVSNTFGWSATADAVDDWIYTEVAETFALDDAMLERLRNLNPHSAHALVRRLLEAHGRGYWDADPGLLDKLNQVRASLEDQLEGVA